MTTSEGGMEMFLALVIGVCGGAFVLIATTLFERAHGIETGTLLKLGLAGLALTFLNACILLWRKGHD